MLNNWTSRKKYCINQIKTINSSVLPALIIKGVEKNEPATTLFEH